jgi:hypothetical protein
MAEPIVRTFVIDTTQAEQNLTSLGTTTKATTAIVDSLYTELIRLDSALNNLSPNDEQFQTLATQIKAVEESITSIETGKFQDIATDVEAVGNAISGVDTSNVEQLNQSIANIDTANAVADIDNINSVLSTIDASTVVSEVDSVNVALDAVDTSNVTGQIENINTEFNNIDSTNVTAGINEISTAISGIDASNAVSEITSIDGALTGINTGEVVSEINNIGEAVADINTDNITNVGNAVEGVIAPVKELANATDQLNVELKDIPKDVVPDKIIPPDLIPPDVIQNAKSLKQQLRELQAELANTEPDSAKYNELAAAAGQLKDQIGDAAEAVGTQAGGAFERVSGSLGLVTGRIANLDFEGAAEGAQLLAKNITEIKPGDITKGIKGIGSAFASIGKALLTNPIFLIGAAIAAAVVYSEELLSLVDGVSSAEQERLAAQQESAKVSKEQLDAIGQQENILKLQGKTEREILQLKIAAAQQAIIDQKAVITTLEIQRQAQIDAAKRNADITKGIVQFLTIPIQILLGTVDTIILGLNKVGVISNETFASIGSLREGLNNSITGLLFDPEQVTKDGDKSIEEAKKTLQGLENTQAGFQLSIKSIDDKAASERNAAAKKAADEKAKDAKDAAEAQIKAEKEVSDLLNQLYEENVKEFEEAEKKKTAAAETEAAKRKKAEEDYNAAITALRIEQDAANLTQDQKDIIAIDNKYLDLREKAIAAGESTAEVDAAYKAALEQQEVDSAEKRKANEFAVQDAKLQATSDALSAINGLVAAFAKGDEKRAKKAFQIQKGLSIAQATVDTYKGANAIFANAAANPSTILFPAQPFIAAGVAIASGLANVATIAQQQFQGGSTGGGGSQNTPSLPEGGGGGGGQDSQPAQFNPLASSFLQDRPEQLTPRAYVLAGDVASQQEVREKVQDLARIG